MTHQNLGIGGNNTMENYKIITDIKELESFINYLPDAGEYEKYYVSLFARKKYTDNPIVKGDKAQLKRFVSHKEMLIDKIKQLEIPIGSYRIMGEPVPQESLALYIMPAPRCLKKATGKLAKNVIDMLVKDTNYNIHAEALTCIQKSKGKTPLLDFDIDTKDFDVSIFKKYLNQDGYKVIETRGGYHILVDPRNQEKTWWNDIFKAAYEVHIKIDQSGDQLLPIPGTFQGGFTPKMISHE